MFDHFDLLHILRAISMAFSGGFFENNRLTIRLIHLNRTKGNNLGMSCFFIYK